MGFISNTKPEDQDEFRRIATDGIQDRILTRLSKIVESSDKEEINNIVVDISVDIIGTFKYIKQLEGR